MLRTNLLVPIMVLCLGCDVGTITSNPPSDDDGGDAGRTPAMPCVSHPDAGTGVNTTCATDCDCAQGLSCQVCVNTAEHNCIEWCEPGDSKCNYGVVTCPVDPGQKCPSVMLCQSQP